MTTLSKFHAFVATLTPKEQQELSILFSAMRGPDQGAGKDFTVFIRRAVWGVNHLTSSVYDHGFKSRATLATAAEGSATWLGHFRDHTRSALRILRRNGYRNFPPL